MYYYYYFLMKRKRIVISKCLDWISNLKESQIRKIAGVCSIRWYTHIVDDARFVSSCLSWPSKAKPLLSLLLANKGLTEKTLDIVNPGETGQPAL